MSIKVPSSEELVLLYRVLMDGPSTASSLIDKTHKSSHYRALHRLKAKGWLKCERAYASNRRGPRPLFWDFPNEGIHSTVRLLAEMAVL